MSKIKLGYGSEWHILRMLGRHRDWFSKKVLEVTKGTEVKWQDFDFTDGIGEASNHGDAETKGLNFLTSEHAVQKAWRAWWPQSGNVHNWDAIGRLQRDGTSEWLLIEAKGNIEELRQSTGAKPISQGGGLEQIQDRLGETQKAVGLTGEQDWTKPYYQYANRLAFLYFLEQQGVAARLMFVYFTGDATSSQTCPISAEEWYPHLHQMKSHLGLTGRSALEQRVHELFVEVCPKATE